MKEPRKKPSLRGQWASISLEQKLAMFVAPVVVFVVTTTLIPAVRDVVWDGFTTKPTVTVPPTTTTPTTTTLGEPCPTIGELSPATGSASVRSSGLEVVDVVPCDSRIEISMRNVGRLVSVVKRAEFRVRAMQTIETHCRGPGAALPISRTYDLRLPAYDGVGQVVGVTVRQQLKPNEADAFAFRVGLAGALLGDEDPRLYQLDVLVYHDREPSRSRRESLFWRLPRPAGSPLNRRRMPTARSEHACAGTWRRCGPCWPLMGSVHASWKSLGRR
jgi:hypothetical protein